MLNFVFAESKVKIERRQYGMDQIKTGRFIAEKRKEQNLTQVQLAEKLGITNRAVSKWETGKSLPDASIMLELCDVLNITVNDLLNGEVVSMENYNKKTEQNLIEMVKQKEQADKNLLTLEVVLGVVSTAFLLAMIAAGAVLVNLGAEMWVFFLMFGIGLAQFIVCMIFALKIEQVAGYYRCEKCGHKYVPTFKSVNFAPHMGRTRYMKCPKCGEKSWQKKVISKD